MSPEEQCNHVHSMFTSQTRPRKASGAKMVAAKFFAASQKELKAEGAIGCSVPGSALCAHERAVRTEAQMARL